MKPKGNQDYKKIFLPIQKEINISMFLSFISTIFYILTLILMAYAIRILTYSRYNKNQVYMLLGGKDQINQY